MKEFLQLMRRFVSPYKKYFGWAILLNMIKTRKAWFYRLNTFWLVTVKVLNSYEKCIFTPDPGFGYLPGWELSGGVFRRCRVDTG